jgi:hypothetical protein
VEYGKINLAFYFKIKQLDKRKARGVEYYAREGKQVIMPCTRTMKSAKGAIHLDRSVWRLLFKYQRKLYCAVADLYLYDGTIGSLDAPIIRGIYAEKYLTALEYDGDETLYIGTAPRGLVLALNINSGHIQTIYEFGINPYP